MKPSFAIAFLFAAALSAPAALAGAQSAQQPASNPFPADAGKVPVLPSDSSQQPAAPLPASSSGSQAAPAGGQRTPAKTPPPSTANPFPEDTGNIPVLPSGSIPAPSDQTAPPMVSVPTLDSDPVRSPDDTDALATDNATSSSSLAGLGDLLPKPGDDTAARKGKKGTDDVSLDVMPTESAQEDISVGNYYMDNHNWKGALSRFQSAMVLSPDDPDVYWGLAECSRHLGDFPHARAYYQKVAEYDPSSRHGKDARKALSDPEIANASAPAANPSH